MEKKKGFIAEFKEFISRGSVLDLAIGMVIGSAFTAIVSSLVDDIIMPLVSLITGGIDFTRWNFALTAGEEPPMLNLGTFIAAIIKFIIVALVIFCIVKAINKAKRKKEEEPAPATTKICPHCCGEVPIAAAKCMFCLSELEVPEEEA